MRGQLESVILVDPLQLRVFCDPVKLKKSHVMRNLGISGFGTTEQVNEGHLCKV